MRNPVRIKSASHGKKKATLEERFWAKVDVKSPELCWQWTSCLSGAGYGTISSGGKGGKQLLAHRVSWEIHNTQIPEGLVVCHKCDNPRCVNPNHLFLGTRKENTRDSMAKGRFCGPPRRPKLTELDVESILKDDRPLYDIAVDFGLHEFTVSAIKRGKKWKAVFDRVAA